MNGDDVTYVVNRNIQYTNVCYFRCGFCAFSKGKLAENLRGPAYLVPLEEIVRRSEEAWERGATEVCLQGGIHPAFTGDYYGRSCGRSGARPRPARARVLGARGVAGRRDARPAAARSTSHSSATRGSARCPARPPRSSTTRCGRVICPDKVTTDQWLEVHAAAHSVGLRSNVTIMFGHVDGRGAGRATCSARARASGVGRVHRVRAAAVRPHGGADLPEGRARPGPTFREALLMHAVGRLALHPGSRTSRPRG